jgi:hypothetical protein
MTQWRPGSSGGVHTMSRTDPPSARISPQDVRRKHFNSRLWLGSPMSSKASSRSSRH